MKLINTDGMSFIGPGSEWFWTAVSGIVLAVTFLAIYRQLRLQASQAAVEQLDAVTREFFSERMMRHQIAVLLAMQAGVDRAHLPEASAAVVADYFDKLGKLARDGHVDLKNIEGMALIGLTWWATLEPFIRRKAATTACPRRRSRSSGWPAIRRDLETGRRDHHIRRGLPPGLAGAPPGRYPGGAPGRAVAPNRHHRVTRGRPARATGARCGGRGMTGAGDVRRSRLPVARRPGRPAEHARRGIMRFLLTSAGIKNASIHDALVDLLDKPIAEASALCIPTANHAQLGGAGHAWRFISGREPRTPMVELGWKSVGVLELTALPSLGEAHWVPMVRETDVLLVNGGDPLYLCYWMHHSGLADLLPSLRETVYVGLSAGSMVLTPTFGTAYDDWFCREPPAPADSLPVADDRALGLVDFSVFPHVDHEGFPQNSMANAEKWAAGRPAPTYAIDDETAVKVVDDAVEIVSEGHWKLLAP